MEEKFNIIENIYYEKIQTLIQNWKSLYSEKLSEGKMRSKRGKDIEELCKSFVEDIGKLTTNKIDVYFGQNDKKFLKLNNIVKKHQVDLHIYKNEKFIFCIECKSYLDSCYYTRACNDFKLFEKFNYDISNYVFCFENALNKDTMIFTNLITDNICNNVFFILENKRNGKIPLYVENQSYTISRNVLKNFIQEIYLKLL
jgi:hypothetical protein